MTHDSALETMFFGAHLGNAPRFSMSLVVRSEPDGVWVRDMTSQEMTWDA